MAEEIKVLFVDDEISVLKALKRLFLDTDYEIITASSGIEGLEIIRNTDHIQVIVSDYRMPEMNGVDFLKEVCQIRADTVRIVLSGYADTAAIVEAINDGQIYKFVAKPWNDDELKTSISQALNHYFISKQNIQLTRELENKNRELREINNNLEKLVEERTTDLIVQNRILTSAQNILDSLPIGVVSIDPEGSVVQCNKMGMDIFSLEEGNILGMERSDSFTEEVNEVIEHINNKGEYSASIPEKDAYLRIKGVHMNYSTGQEGIILVVDKRCDEYGNS